MKKYLLTLTVILSTLFLFSCNVTALVTDIIQREDKPKEITFKINHTNTSETESEYQFKFADDGTVDYIPLEYCKNITFDFNNFHGTEGKIGSKGEVGFFFNLKKYDRNKNTTYIDNWDEDIPMDRRLCSFYLLTVNKYVDYDINYLGTDNEGKPTTIAPTGNKQTPPTVYEINIYKYENINYPNLINKFIIGDKNGYDINTIYCDVECTVKQAVQTVKVDAKDFKKITYIKELNDLKLIEKYNLSIFSKIENIFGIYSKVNKNKLLNCIWHFNNSNDL